MVDTDALSEMTEAIDREVEKAVDEVVKSYIPTLDDYLDALDKGEFECMCSNDVEILFTPAHKVIAKIPVKALEGYTWAFRMANIEVEVDGTFEARLS